MKNVGQIIFAFICLIIFVNIGCKPKSNTKNCKLDGSCPPQYYRMELGDAKAYLWAKPGSYWIYKNTATGDIDTQTCTSFYFDSITVYGTEPSTSYIKIKYDFLSRSIRSKFNKLTYYDETERYEPDAPLRPLKTVFERHGGIGAIVAFSHPFVVGEHFSDGFGTMTCKRLDSSLTIQGKKYYNVASYEIDIDGVWENTPPYTGSIYYWAKDVGLIKRTAKNLPDNWELIDYNIIH